MPSHENLISSLVAFVEQRLARGVVWHPLLDDVQQDIGIQKDAHSALGLNAVFLLEMGHAHILCWLGA